MSIINGYQAPRFTILSNGSVIATIDLPLTGSGGLVEGYTIVNQRATNIAFSRSQKIHGFHITWQLNYDEYITGESMLLIKQIIEYAKAGYDIWLTPRKDHPWRAFKVYISSDNFSLGLRKGGSAAKAHRLVVLEFATIDAEPDLKWYTSDTVPVITHVCNESIKFII